MVAALSPSPYLELALSSWASAMLVTVTVACSVSVMVIVRAAGAAGKFSAAGCGLTKTIEKVSVASCTLSFLTVTETT